MAEQQTFGDFGFQCDPIQATILDHPSFRELIESIAVAIILAMIFKTLQAEAYIIPTGSMAPNLMGQHMDLKCNECGVWFQAGTDKTEAPGTPVERLTSDVACPMCHKVQQTDREALKKLHLQSFKKSEYDPNRESFSGDRIVVNKIHYIFNSPKRWDVIVFKYPGSAKQNYIKRLVGLPGETVQMTGGDIYIAKTADLENSSADLSREKTIARKPPEKLLSMMVPVSDSNFFSKDLRNQGWPANWFTPPGSEADSSVPWSAYRSSENHWKSVNAEDQPVQYQIQDSAAADSQNLSWIRFQNMIPNETIWEKAKDGESIANILPRPSAITDDYGYNDFLAMPVNLNHLEPEAQIQMKNQIEYRKATLYNPYGQFWVGDLILESEMQIDSPKGILAFDLVEGGIHYLCELNLETSKGTIRSVSSLAKASSKFQSESGSFDKESIEFSFPALSSGSHKIRYANCDDQVVLWINDSVVDLPQKGHYKRTGPCSMTYHSSDPGDLNPAGIGAAGADLKVTRMKLFRDLYYFHEKHQIDSQLEGFGSFGASKNIWNSPLHWNMAAKSYPLNLADSSEPLDWSMGYQLQDGQYFPLGDNSPISLDARRWKAPFYVEQRYMIGKAFVVYWPHTWNNPPFVPNFSQMRWIR